MSILNVQQSKVLRIEIGFHPLKTESGIAAANVLEKNIFPS